jgi:peptidyl-prolyl cis-trans isomerase SurA
LYAHQAIQDSVIIKDGEVRDKMNTNWIHGRTMSSMDKVIKYFKVTRF